MSFSFVKVRRNMHVGTNPGTKYLAKLFRMGTIDQDTIVSRIAQNTQVSETIVVAVLKATEMQLGQYLNDGVAVKLPFVGMFVPTFNAKAKTTLAQVDASTISDYTFRFVPSKYLKTIAKNTKAKEANLDIYGLQSYGEALTEEQFKQLQKMQIQEEEMYDDIEEQSNQVEVPLNKIDEVIIDIKESEE